MLTGQKNIHNTSFCAKFYLAQYSIGDTALLTIHNSGIALYPPRPGGRRSDVTKVHHQRSRDTLNTLMQPIKLRID